MPAADGFHEKKFDELIKNKWQTAEREIAVQLGNSQECVSKIVDVLLYHTVCMRHWPREYLDDRFILSPTQKRVIDNGFSITPSPVRLGMIRIDKNTYLS